jgi:hypothetical protein
VKIPAQIKRHSSLVVGNNYVDTDVDYSDAFNLTDNYGLYQTQNFEDFSLSKKDIDHRSQR